MATFGTTSEAGTSTGGASTTLVATKYALSETAYTVSIHVYTPTSGNVKGAIYSDNAGAPNALLVAQNTQAAATGGQWNTITISEISLSVGNYWVAIKTDTNNMRAYKAGGASQAAYYGSDTYSNSFASTFPTPSGYQNNDYVCYVTYNTTPTSAIKTVSGISRASIKTISGVAIASVKKIAGVA